MSLCFRFFHEQAEKETEAERNLIDESQENVFLLFFYLAF